MEISMKRFLISCFSPRTIGVTASSSPALAFPFSLAPSLISLFPLDFFSLALASCFLCILILQPDNPKQPLPPLIFLNHSFAWTLFIAHKWPFRFQRQIKAEPSRALGVTRDQAVGCCRATDGGESNKNCPLYSWNLPLLVLRSISSPTMRRLTHNSHHTWFRNQQKMQQKQPWNNTVDHKHLNFQCVSCFR